MKLVLFNMPRFLGPFSMWHFAPMGEQSFTGRGHKVQIAMARTRQAMACAPNRSPSTRVPQRPKLGLAVAFAQWLARADAERAGQLQGMPGLRSSALGIHERWFEPLGALDAGDAK